MLQFIKYSRSATQRATAGHVSLDPVQGDPNDQKSALKIKQPRDPNSPRAIWMEGYLHVLKNSSQNSSRLFLQTSPLFGLDSRIPRTRFDCPLGMLNKDNLQNKLQNPALGTLTNLKRSLTSWLEDSYYSITVVNHRLIIIIRFVAKSYTHP